jgi:F-type H+-transporting ATPase subunit epsilon
MILEIISPEKIVSMNNIEYIVLPSIEGDIGILKGHAPVILIVKKGKLKFVKDSKPMNIILLNNGFAHVTPDKTRVILEEF